MVMNVSFEYEEDSFLGYNTKSTSKLFSLEQSLYRPWLENNSFFVEGLEDVYFDQYVFNEILIRKDAQVDKHSPKVLPAELLDNYQIIQEASKSNPLKILETEEEQLAYIQKMEKVWNRTTQQHMHYMQAKGLEGNVDERAWYRIACQLKKAGVLKDLEV